MDREDLGKELERYRAREAEAQVLIEQLTKELDWALSLLFEKHIIPETLRKLRYKETRGESDKPIDWPLLDRLSKALRRSGARNWEEIYEQIEVMGLVQDGITKDVKDLTEIPESPKALSVGINRERDRNKKL